MENNRRSFKLLRYFCLIFVMLFGAIAIISSGGGGGGGDGDDDGDDGGDDSASEYATITGTVAGTTVIAVDEYFEEVDRDTATGTPKTFTLTVPGSMIYSFYLIENEGTDYERIYPLYQGEVNQFDITAAVTIDLGFVDISSGVAVPENNPLNVSGVVAFGENPTIPSFFSGTSFSMESLQARWNIHILTTGVYGSAWDGWSYGTLDINNSGDATSNMTNSDALTIPASVPGAFSITTSGAVSCLPELFTNFNGAMSIDLNLILATADDGAGGCLLIAAQRQNGEVTYTASDLDGTWHYHMITTAGTSEGWTHGTMSGDDFYYVENPPNWYVSTGNGSFTNFNASMSLDKNTIVATEGDSSKGYSLIIFQKGGSTFVQSDLEGTWNGHSLVVGSAPTDPVGWEYQSYTIDAGGYITNMSVKESSGNSDITTSSLGPLTINSSGKISTDFVDNFDGILSLDKKLMVATYDDDVGKHLLIGQK